MGIIQIFEEWLAKESEKQFWDLENVWCIKYNDMKMLMKDNKVIKR